MKKKIIDPASGWKYGFPKVYDNPSKLSITDWLLENGYPQSELNKEGIAHYVRFWDHEVDDEG